MSEGSITLEKPIFSADGTQTGSKTNAYQVTRDSGLVLPVGGMEGKKQQINILNPRKTTDNSKEVSRELLFISKEFKTKQEVLDIIRANNILREKGYPVPQVCRYFEKDGKHHLLMSDMTEGGKYSIWGPNDNMSMEQKNTLDSMNIYHESREDIEQQITQLARKGLGDGIYLSAGAYHIRKDQTTEKYHIVLLDINLQILDDPINTNNLKEKDLFMAYLDVFDSMKTSRLLEIIEKQRIMPKDWNDDL